MHNALCSRGPSGCIRVPPGAVASLHVKKACSRSVKTWETRRHLAARASACPSQLALLLPGGAAGTTAGAGATGAPEPPDLQPRPQPCELLQLWPGRWDDSSGWCQGCAQRRQSARCLARCRQQGQHSVHGGGTGQRRTCHLHTKSCVCWLPAAPGTPADCLAVQRWQLLHLPLLTHSKVLVVDWASRRQQSSQQTVSRQHCSCASPLHATVRSLPGS